MTEWKRYIVAFVVGIPSGFLVALAIEQAIPVSQAASALLGFACGAIATVAIYLMTEPAA